MPPKAPQAKAKTKKQKLEATRVTNAKALRTRYAEVKHAPDGVDLEPLTVPKCVECPNCLFPVWPRQSKVATRKTYERAGLDRDGKKPGEKEEPKKNDDEDSSSEEEEQDGESIATEDRLRDELDDANEKIENLEEQNQYLEETKVELEGKLKETEQALGQAEDRIDFLEEAEKRWRDKCTDLRQQNADLRLIINEQAIRLADTETDIVAKLLDIRQMNSEFAKYRRRRALMLDRNSDRMGAEWIAQNFSFIFRFWRGYTFQEKSRRAYETLEAFRTKQVLRLQEQLALSRARCQDTEEKIVNLRGRLKAAGHRLLMRSLGSTEQPFAGSNALRAWMAAAPLMKMEHQLKERDQNIEGLQLQIQAEEDKTFAVRSELYQVDAARLEYKLLSEQQAGEIQGLCEQLEQFGQERAAAAAAAAERAADMKAQAEAEAFDKAQEVIEEAKKRWQMERRLLEEQLDIAQSSGTGPAVTKEVEKEEDRIVPKGQGVLCCGCLKQLVHRSVKPLKPEVALKGPSPKLEKAQRAFFKKELAGMPDPDDPLHAFAWTARKDPYGATKFTRAGNEVAAVWQRHSSRSKLTPLRQQVNPLSPMRETTTAKDFKPMAFR